MAIDKDEFLGGMAVLAGAFGREIDGPVQRAYYHTLSPALTTAEFIAAVQLALETETYWPSPAVLLGKVNATDAAKARIAFEHVTRVLSEAGGFRLLTAETYTREFDAPTKAAIAAVGGLGTITNTPEDRWESLQRRFAAAFATSLRPQLGEPERERKRAPKQLGHGAYDGPTLVGDVIRTLPLTRDP